MEFIWNCSMDGEESFKQSAVSSQQDFRGKGLPQKSAEVDFR
jgi:hypothetical protein